MDLTNGMDFQVFTAMMTVVTETARIFADGQLDHPLSVMFRLEGDPENDKELLVEFQYNAVTDDYRIAGFRPIEPPDETTEDDAELAEEIRR